MINVAKWNLDQVNLESGFFMILGVDAGTCLCSVTVLVGVCLQGWFLHTGDMETPRCTSYFHRFPANL